MWDDFGFIEEHILYIVFVLVFILIGFIFTDCGLQTCSFIDLGCVHIFQDDSLEKQKRPATGNVHPSKDFPKEKTFVSKLSDHCVVAVEVDNNNGTKPASLYPDLNQNFLVASPEEIDWVPPRTGPSKNVHPSYDMIYQQQPPQHSLYNTLSQIQEERLNFLEMILLPSAPSMYPQNWRNLFFNSTNPFMNRMMMNRWTQNQNYSPNALEYPSVFSSETSAWTSPFISETSAWASPFVASDTICYM